MQKPEKTESMADMKARLYKAEFMLRHLGVSMQAALNSAADENYHLTQQLQTLRGLIDTFVPLEAIVMPDSPSDIASLADLLPPNVEIIDFATDDRDIDQSTQIGLRMLIKDIKTGRGEIIGQSWVYPAPMETAVKEIRDRLPQLIARAPLPEHYKSRGLAGVSLETMLHVMRMLSAYWPDTDGVKDTAFKREFSRLFSETILPEARRSEINIGMTDDTIRNRALTTIKDTFKKMDGELGR